ncbi:MAG: hypothetical protein FWF01_04145 [Alphaproteobacteria bacterium]|nr:hypothetical protein [Alphaproteobacteria bacterium]
MQKNMLFIVAALVALFPVAASSRAQQGNFDRLTLSADRVWAAPGDTVILYLWEEGGIGLDTAEATETQGQGAPVVMSRRRDVMQGTVRIPPTFSGVKTYSAIGTSGKRVFGTRNTVRIVVQPDIRTIGRLRTEPRSRLEIAAGESAQLRVFGLWPDARQFDITRHELGTIYFSANDPIATVDRDGMVNAKRAGDTVIYIRNGNAGTHVMVNVLPSR